MASSTTRLRRPPPGGPSRPSAGPGLRFLRGTVEPMNSLAIEHGSTRAGRWLRARRLRIALWIAVIEGLLVIFHVIPVWAALLVAAAVLAFYLFVGRDLRSDVLRQASWVAAGSQALVAMIP